MSTAATWQRKDACLRGHPYTPENTYQRPGEEHWRECRECRRQAAAKRNVGPRPRATEVRFFAKVRQGGACWIFTQIRPDGYGSFWFDGRPVPAHRWAYQYLRAAIPEGLQLDHLCRNRACVNPWHLEPVTARVNTLRGETITARLSIKTTCPRGHDYVGPNLRITPTGRRVCRACHRINAAASRARAA